MFWEQNISKDANILKDFINTEGKHKKNANLFDLPNLTLGQHNLGGDVTTKYEKKNHGIRNISKQRHTSFQNIIKQTI